MIRHIFSLSSSLVVAAALASRAFAAPVPDVPADSTAMDWSRVSEYRIVPGDKLAIDYGPAPDKPGDSVHETKVRPDGRITVFPVGDVIAAGLTPMELQKNIVALLSAEYKLPRVTVEVVEPAGNLVHVLGRVEKPGSYPAGPFVTLMQAIGEAGGFKDDAARNSVLVFHRDGARTLRVTRIRVDRLLKGDDLLDITLSRFDIVYVPRSSIGNLDVFAQQFFGSTQTVLSSALVGWELFNLDRVFVTRVVRE